MGILHEKYLNRGVRLQYRNCNANDGVVKRANGSFGIALELKMVSGQEDTWLKLWQFMEVPDEREIVLPC